MTFHTSKLAIVISLAVLVGCALPADVDEPPVNMGNFKFGHNVVVVNEPEIGPFSRKQTDGAWNDALTAAMDNRFGGYDGDKFYHIGVKLDAYVLALPGVPVVFKPKSVIVLTANIWDDSLGEKLNEEAKVLTVFEGISGETLVSSGLTRNKDEQMTVLVNNAAKAIQDWILENPEWVGLTALDGAVAEVAVLDGAEAISQTTLGGAPAN